MQNIRSAVFVNYSGEWLDSIVQNKSELPGSTLILNQEGVVVSGGGYFPMLTDASDMEFTAGWNHRGRIFCYLH